MLGEVAVVVVEGVSGIRRVLGDVRGAREQAIGRERCHPLTRVEEQLCTEATLVAHVPVAGAVWEGLDPDGDQRVRATIAGQSRTVVFPSERKRALELRTLADWVVRPRLMKVTGVAQVTTMGGGRKQYQVLVDPTALHEYGLSLQDVEEALKANNVNFTGGYAERGGFERACHGSGPRGVDMA